MQTIGSQKPRRALVIGASIGGLFATALLRRAGMPRFTNGRRSSCSAEVPA
jgi:cation diffusion facilitator CzcD-associated flavoprotein CzcO